MRLGLYADDLGDRFKKMGQLEEEIVWLEWKMSRIYALDSDLWLKPQVIETPGIQT